MRTFLVVLCTALSVSVPHAQTSPGASIPVPQHRAQSDAPASSPVSFEENRGQFAPRIRYGARGSRASTFITDRGALQLLLRAPLSAAPAAIGLVPTGANLAPAIEGVAPLPGRVHSYRGSDPRAWVRDIPTSARVRIHDLYPGIDVEYYGSGSAIEYDFVVAPRSAPGSIRIRVEN